VPSTFAGQYIKEPSDLRVVCTEADIIAVCDDPGGEDARDILIFSGLSENQKAAIVAVMNSLIPAVEREIDGYAMKAGYAVPLSPLDADVTKIAARMLWIDMRQTNGRIDADTADKQRNAIRDGELTDISKGRLILTAAKNTSAPAPASHVYDFASAHQRDTDGTVPRMSRKTLGGL
jgi:hypothetical protein